MVQLPVLRSPWQGVQFMLFCVTVQEMDSYGFAGRSVTNETCIAPVEQDAAGMGVGVGRPHVAQQLALTDCSPIYCQRNG